MTYSWKKGDQKVWKLPKMSPFSSKYVKKNKKARVQDYDNYFQRLLLEKYVRKNGSTYNIL